MPGIDREIAEHRIPTHSHVVQIKQKKRRHTPKKQVAISEEINKHLKAGFIREVYYPDWLSNVVLVKKANSKWRMCVNFTDLNMVCLNDSYPLPSIGQLVDSTAGYELYNFMDAYAGYNQIRMSKSSEEKTSFITNIKVYCYKAIPFDLKNERATYLRLVN